MADETKRPTVEDIELLRSVVDVGMRETLALPETSAAEAVEITAGWLRFGAVLDYAAACLRAEEEAERVPEVEAPEDAGDDGWIAWEGGECPVPRGADYGVELRDGTAVDVMDEPPTALNWDHRNSDGDIVRYRLAQPSQPPTDPEARVGAMSDEEVEAELHGKVSPWARSKSTGHLVRYHVIDGIETHYYAVNKDGCVIAGQPPSGKSDNVTGDTTTPEGRAECSRRLLVHLLREEVARG